MMFSPEVDDELSVLKDSDSIFIGRDKSTLDKYGRDGALLTGKVIEKDDFGKLVYLDALSPHVIFISGARGSGKSYSLSVIAEELSSKNPNAASVIVDPVGIFWSMKYPNQDEGEVEALAEMGLDPRGVDDVRVFVPEGVSNKIAEDTYDLDYALKPSDLTAEDWTLTFGMDRFSPKGMVIEKAIELVENGYETEDNEKIKEKGDSYSVQDLIDCINSAKKIKSSGKGFSSASRRAIVSRLESAKSWGVLSKSGVSLTELCKEGAISVIDVSFLEEDVMSLVIGILARKILNARKISARRTSMKKFALDSDVLETDIPPTWLFIDEAHTLVPSGSGKTPASEPLIEYVKQGRRPGCSLVLATQQPSAIDTKVLSQLDVLMCHKLVFDRDLKEVMKRMPTSIPKEYKKSGLMKKLPIGCCIVGDRSDASSRAFAMKVRPRFSQHEGREIKSIGMEGEMSEEELTNALTKLVLSRIENKGRIHEDALDDLVDTIERRYDTEIDRDNLLGKLKSKGVLRKEDHLVAEGAEGLEEEKEKSKEESASAEPEGNVTVFKPKMSEKKAKEIAKKTKKSKFLGVFGKEEFLRALKLKYKPVYKVDYDYYKKKGQGFRKSVCFVDATEAEILAVGKNGLVKSKGVSELLEMSKSKRKILIALKKGKSASAKTLAKIADVSEGTARKSANELVEEGFLNASENKVKAYSLAKDLDLPEDITRSEYTSLESRFVMDEKAEVKTVEPVIEKDSAEDFPSAFGEIGHESTEVIYLPVYEATLLSEDGERKILINALNGEVTGK